MKRMAVIGGTGLADLGSARTRPGEPAVTPYGETSGPLVTVTLSGREVIFLPRHGNPHTIAPHRINYRANIRSLKDRAIDTIIAVNAVGGITTEMAPCTVVIPDQIIDYTWSRPHTFFEEDADSLIHIDFTHPYNEALRQVLLTDGKNIGLEVTGKGTYAATQGPRLETAAEIDRLDKDGCDIVGMTGMPEAALARELEMDYASVSLVVNRAAGRSGEPITMDIIDENLRIGMDRIRKLLNEAARIL